MKTKPCHDELSIRTHCGRVIHRCKLPKGHEGRHECIRSRTTGIPCDVDWPPQKAIMKSWMKKNLDGI